MKMIKTTGSILILLCAWSASASVWFVDPSSGNDAHAGTSTSTAWLHSPGDIQATGTASTQVVSSGDTININPVLYQFLAGGGVGISYSNGVTYIGDDNVTWGAAAGSRCHGTDNYGTSSMAMFGGNVGSGVTIRGFEIGPFGGAPNGGGNLPTSPQVGPNSGVGVYGGTELTAVAVSNCFFHDLGYWYNGKPMTAGSINGAGVSSQGCSNLLVINCVFSNVANAVLMSGNSFTNLDIASNYFTGAFQWTIACSVPGAITETNVWIHDNFFYNVNYYYTLWTGYGGDGPHQNTFINDNASAYNSVIGGNLIQFYNNLLVNSTPYENGSFGIWFLNSPQAAVYNNVFNSITPANSMVGLTSILNNQPCLYLVFNNDFAYGVSSIGGARNMLGWSGPDNNGTVWPSNSLFFEANNIYYKNDPNNTNWILFQSISSVQGGLFNPILHWYMSNDCFYAMANATNFIANVIGGANDLPNIQTAWAGAADGTGWGQNDITLDPKFADISELSTSTASNCNFHLQAGSPCIGVGANLTVLATTYNLRGLTSDKDHVARPAIGAWNMGPYQTTNAAPQPPVTILGQVFMNQQVTIKTQ
jgi:hypothetical protein